MRRFGPRRFLRALWDGFVVFGLLHALGESQPDDLTRRRAVYDEPPRATRSGCGAICR